MMLEDQTKLGELFECRFNSQNTNEKNYIGRNDIG